MFSFVSTLERQARADHPAEEDLHRFMRGETAPRETREIVRHLLRGCLACTGVTGRLWDLAEPGPRLDSRPPRIHAGGPHGRAKMTGLETVIEQVRDIAREVENLQFRLLGVQSTLPEATAESVRLLDVDPMDATTEIRAIIDCVLRDRIEPALRELRKLGAKKKGQP
jgi:hypothetical protein